MPGDLSGSMDIDRAAASSTVSVPTGTPQGGTPAAVDLSAMETLRAAQQHSKLTVSTTAAATGAQAAPAPTLTAPDALLSAMAQARPDLTPHDVDGLKSLDGWENAAEVLIGRTDLKPEDLLTRTDLGTPALHPAVMDETARQLLLAREDVTPEQLMAMERSFLGWIGAETDAWEVPATREAAGLMLAREDVKPEQLGNLYAQLDTLPVGDGRLQQQMFRAATDTLSWRSDLTVDQLNYFVTATVYMDDFGLPSGVHDRDELILWGFEFLRDHTEFTPGGLIIYLRNRRTARHAQDGIDRRKR